MKKVITIIMTLALASVVNAFVLMGPSDMDTNATPNENTLDTAGTLPPTGIAGHFQTIQSANFEDGYLGTPKDRTRFFRVNTPYLTYGFDQTFMQFFGREGIRAIDDAMDVINDFFKPEDGSYDGVSGPTGLDLTTHGFSQNFATYWLNGTAENLNLIDMKSVALGYMVNRLGLGNPHRYAFTAYELDANQTPTSGIAVWKTKLNNYDPLDPINTIINTPTRSYTPGKTDMINNVRYSYRMIHNQAPGLNLAAPFTGWNNLIAEMEEYTDDTSGNAYSAVAAIIDAFYGGTQITWINPPSQFNFGVFYDGTMSSGGQRKKRHALTLDDAGGLKYLYSTNTIAMEFNPYRAVSPADYVKGVHNTYAENNALASSLLTGRTPKPGNEVRVGGNPWQPIHNPNPRAVFPLRNGGGVMLTPGNTTFPISPLNPLYHLQTVPNIGSFMDGTAFTGPGVGKMAWAYRGGINKIKMVKLHYDSLLDTTPGGKAFVWKDTFITNLNVNIPNTVGLPGVGDIIKGRPQYFTQIVGRNVTVPDFLFSARKLIPMAGIPIAFEDNATFDFNGSNGPSLGGIGAAGFLAPNNYAIGNNTLFADASWTSGGVRANPQASQPLGAANNGPGIWAPAETTTTFTLTFNSEYNIGGFETLWQGELSVDGNTTVPPVANQQWAHIFGPGINDFVSFPDKIDFGGSTTFYNEWANSVFPVAGKPTISVVSKNGGHTPIGNNSFYRTQDSMTIRGSSFRSASAIQILTPSGDTACEISPIPVGWIKSNTLIEIPQQILNDFDRVPRSPFAGYYNKPENVEGSAMRVKVWNTVGPSELSPNAFTIKTGPSVLTGTSHDAGTGIVYFRDGPLILYGHGFKSKRTVASDGNFTLTSIQISDTAGNPIWPPSGGLADISGYIQILSDNQAFINSDAFPSSVDGTLRVIKVARSTTQTMSAPIVGATLTISAASAIITDLKTTYTVGSYLDDQNRSDAVNAPLLELTPGPGTTLPPFSGTHPGAVLRRDAVIKIIGTGLGSVDRIELLRINSLQPFNPPVFLDETWDPVRWNANVSKTPNGSLITLAANAFNTPGADGFGSKRACIKVFIGSYAKASAIFNSGGVGFNVNRQPAITIVGSPPGLVTGLSADGNLTYNRATGQEIQIAGRGLNAVKWIRIQASDSLQDTWDSPPNLGGRTLPATINLPVDGNVAWAAPTVTRTEAQEIFGSGGVFIQHLVAEDQLLRLDASGAAPYGRAIWVNPLTGGIGDTADANATGAGPATPLAKLGIGRAMQFRLQCEDKNRTIVSTTANNTGNVPGQDGFIVGVTPVATSFVMSGTATRFQRDSDNASIRGTGLQIISGVEFTDPAGVMIVGADDPAHGGVAGRNSLAFYPDPVHNLTTFNKLLIEMDAEGVRLDINGSVIANLGQPMAYWAGAHADSVVPGSRTIIIETPWGSTLNSTTVLNAATCPPFMISGPVQFDAANLNNIWDPTFPMDYTINERWVNARTGAGGAGSAATILTTFSTVDNGGVFAQQQTPGVAVGEVHFPRAFGTFIVTTGGGYDFNGSDSPGGGATALAGLGQNTGESTQMQDLVINGRGFRGVSRIELWDSVGADPGTGSGVYSLLGANVTGVTVDFNSTLAPVAGITCNYGGTQIIITGKWIHDNNYTWAQQSVNIQPLGSHTVPNGDGSPGTYVADGSRHIRFFTGDGTTLYGRTQDIETNATAY